MIGHVMIGRMGWLMLYGRSLKETLRTLLHQRIKSFSTSLELHKSRCMNNSALSRSQIVWWVVTIFWYFTPFFSLTCIIGVFCKINMAKKWWDAIESRLIGERQTSTRWPYTLAEGERVKDVSQWFYFNLLSLQCCAIFLWNTCCRYVMFNKIIDSREVRT
jgi:hypothetical protein